jgi:DNA-binding transcriptional LysR family regulator
LDALLDQGQFLNGRDCCFVVGQKAGVGSMEMHQVRYFLAAARALNFTRAAEESNVSQPSLTRAIQKLEDEFGGLLFRRERSLTHLTELGRLMVPHLERTLEAAQAAKMLAKGIGKDMQAPMMLGVAGNISAHLRSALAEVASALPGFQLSLVKADAETLIHDMLKGDIDASILVEPRLPPDRLDRIELVRQAFGVVAPKNSSLVQSEKTCIKDLVSVQWIEGDSDVAREFRERCAEAGIEPDFRHTAASEPDLVELVACGLGCAIVPLTLVLPETVVSIAIEGIEISRATVFATVSGRKRSTATDALIRAIKARSWAAD